MSDIVETGTYAPSGSNTQCYRFLIITNKKDIEFLSKTKLKLISQAPAVILVMADLEACVYLKTNRSEVFKYLPYQDCAMAIQNMILYAESIRLSTCVIHLSEQWPTAKQIKTHFNLSNQYELMGLVLIGFANEKINYHNDKHANRKIERKPVNDYILEWR